MMLKQVTQMIFMTLVLLPLSLLAKEQDCFPKTKAQKWIQDFNISINTFESDDLCRSESDLKLILEDLQLIENAVFIGKKENIFILDIIDQNQYFVWLKDQTNGIRRAHDIPFATAYNTNGYFTLQDGWRNLSSLGRVGTLIHEARHTEGSNHIRCIHGPYKNSSVQGCDQSVEQKGSHAVEMEFYARVVLEGQNFHPVFVQMARLMTLARSNFVFNIPPVTRREILVGLSSDHIITQNHDQLVESIELPSKDMARLKRSSAGFTLILNDQVQTIDFASDNPIWIDDEFTYYKILNDDRLKGIIDLEEYDTNERRFVVALTNEGMLYTYKFSQGSWSSGVRAQDVKQFVTTDPNGKEGLYILTYDKDLYPLDPSTLTRGDRSQTIWPATALQFFNWENHLYRIEASNNIQSSNIFRSDNKKHFLFNNQKLNQVIKAPVYDIFN